MLAWAEQTRRDAARLGEAAFEVAASGQVAQAHHYLGRPASDAILEQRPAWTRLILVTTMSAQAAALIQLGRLDEAGEKLAAAIDAGRLAPQAPFSITLGCQASSRPTTGTTTPRSRPARRGSG